MIISIITNGKLLSITKWNVCW